MANSGNPERDRDRHGIADLSGGPRQLEALLWIAFYVVWVIWILGREVSNVFATIFVGSVLSGLWTGVVQMALMDSYLTSNPEYAAAMAGQPV